MLIGYARCSRERKDLNAQRKALRELGVQSTEIHVDRGLSGDPPRPALEKTLARLSRRDTLVVSTLSRLARSARDAAWIAEQLSARGAKLSLAGVVYDPRRETGRRFFELVNTFAEFEFEVVQLRTREGMAVARANGRLKGKPPKLTVGQHAELLELHTSGELSISELAQRMSVSRATIYRALQRARSDTASAPAAPPG
jgi:DNA invertase Pin-like site-specific DNA recombinase